VVTYDNHLRLIGKHVVNFLLVSIELFRLVLRLRGYERVYWFKIGDYAPTEAGLTQNYRYKGSPHQPFFLSEN